MIIACDVDDVICNLQEVVISLFNKRFGSHYTMDNFTDYDIMNILPTQDGIAMRDMYGESGLYKTKSNLLPKQKSLYKS